MSENGPTPDPSSEPASDERLDWQGFFRRSSPEAALRAVAAWIGDEGVLDLSLEIPGRARTEVVRHRGSFAPAATSSDRLEASVLGRPTWTLVARPGSVPPALLEQAAWALSAWRAARLDQSRADARLRSSAHDLDVLQTIGRKAAEARTPSALFDVVAASLHEGTGLDVVAIVHALGGMPEAATYTSRGITESDLRAVLGSTAEALGWTSVSDISIDRHPLSGVDTTDVVRPGISVDDWLRTPLLRRGNPLGELLVLPSESLGEREKRLIYGASNLIALHLDRILTVREAEKGRFRSILDSMPQAVFLTDRGLQVVQANVAAESLLSSLGSSSFEGILERVGTLDLRPLAADVLMGRSKAAAGEAHLESGALLAVTLSPLESDVGNAEGLVLVLADVTDSRRMQEHLAQSEKLGSLGQMLSGVAHELNNPLATILGFAQLVRGWTSDEKLSKRLAIIHDEARRCQRIVQNLLQFARRREPERRPFSLNEAADSVLNLLSYQLRVDGIHVLRDLDHELPAVHGDAHALQQVIVNLVTNAHQAIRASGQPGNVRIRTWREAGDRVGLEISDDGPGVPAEIRSRIFDPFFTTKEPGQGTGLGLSLVYGTVAAHGGTIRLVSSEHGGAAFRIDLPQGASSPRSVAARDRGACEGPPQSARILVIDDEEALAMLMCEALAVDGHRAVSAADGPEALRRLSSEDYDLIVSDLRMPGVGAARLRAEMELLKPGLSSRLLLTTGDTVTPEADLLAAEMGVDVLYKPFDLDDLRRAVRTRLERPQEH